MKRFLLLITMVLALAGWASAETKSVTFDFANKDYGLTRTNSGNPQYVKSETLVESPATIDLSVVSGNGFAMWKDGLRVYRVNDKTAGDATLTVKVADANITKIVMKVGGNLTTVNFNGAKLTAKSKVYTWSGDAESVAINVQTKTNSSIITLEVFYEEVSSLTPVTLAFSESSVSVVEQDMVEAPALTGVPEGVEVTYTSSDATIAYIEEGYIMAEKPGTVTITATTPATETYAEGKAELTVTVTAKPDDRKDAGLSFGETTEVTAYVGQEEVEVPTLQNPNNLDVTWTSSNEGVAMAEDKVVVIGEAGTAVITAAFAGNDEFRAGSASYTIIVKKNPSNLSYSASEVEKYLNSTEYGEFPILANPDNIEVTYTSSKPEVATVDAEGAITIVAAGTTTITAAPADAAKYEGTASYTLTVTDAAVARGKYVQLTEIANLTSGSKGILVNKDASKAAGGLDNGWFPGVNVTFTDNDVTDAADALVITFIEGNEAGKYALQIGEGQYLVWDSSTKMKTSDEAVYYEISLNSQKNATIFMPRPNDKASDRSIQFITLSDGTPSFRAYAVSSNKPVQIYLEVPAEGVEAPSVEVAFAPVEGAEGTYMTSFKVEEGVAVYYNITNESVQRVAGKDGLEYTKYTEPFEVKNGDNLTYYGEIKGVKSETKSLPINSQTTGVEDVIVTDSAEAEYFDLQGRLVANPANGIFIRRSGATVTKVAL